MKDEAKNNHPVSLALIPAEFLDQLLKNQERILELLRQQEEGQGPLGDYIPESEARRMLGRKTTWFWNLRSKGLLSFSKVGNKVYYAKSEILRLISNGYQARNLKEN